MANGYYLAIKCPVSIGFDDGQTLGGRLVMELGHSKV